jgi:ribosome-associated translation inhibitor RaiA
MIKEENMLTDFRYKGFTADEPVEAESQEILDHIQKAVPIGTAVVASLEFDGTYYTCSVDIYLKRGSFYAQANDIDPIQALHNAEETILTKVYKTKETRFYTRSDRLTNETPNPSEYVN